MYYDDCTFHRDGKTYRRELLRESRRVNGKVVKRTLANLSGWPEPVKLAIRRALRAGRQGGPGPTPEPGVSGGGGYALQQGQSVGALYLLRQVATELGLPAALGDDRPGRLALWQVCARLQDQGSRLSAVRLARTQAVTELLGLRQFGEDVRYANLDWLADEQAAIEDRLFQIRYRNRQPPSLFLYDVTSTYREGVQNELAAFGYNRDGKRGKEQLVIGLLTDQDGWPLTIEVFPGNTGDPDTVGSQIQKLAARFGGAEVTLVGDRGMLKSRQLAALTAQGMHYITAITKPQIASLLKTGTLQLELFEAEVAEVVAADEGVRYVVRCNPEQAARMAARRADQLATWQQQVAQRQQDLAAHPRAQVATALRHLRAKATRLKLQPWVEVEAEGRTLRVVIDDAARAEIAKLDGCYVLKTDLRPAQATAVTVDARYRELAQVEWAFRTSKTAFLELRPVNVRLAPRTRGHVFVVMLAYLVEKRLAELWRAVDLTVEEGLHELAQLCVTTLTAPGGVSLDLIPEPRPVSAQLLAAAGVVLPARLPRQPGAVDTTRKLNSHRK